MTRITIIMNKASGAAAEQKQADLRAAVAGQSTAMTIVEAGPGKIVECAQMAASNCDALIAAGGDGTVSAVAAAAIAAGKVFGVVPFGTLNHFAGDLGLPNDLAAALDIIAAGHTTAIDYGLAGDTVFLNNASLGVYPTLVRRREKQQKKLGKWPAAVLEAWNIVRRPIARQLLTITAAGQIYRLRTAFVFIGNNDYHLEAAGFGNRTSLTAGRLSLFAIRGGGRWGIMQNAVRTLIGRINHPEILSLNAGELTITAQTPSMQLAHDGEVDTMPSPLAFKIVPGGLTLLAPRPPQP